MLLGEIKEEKEKIKMNLYCKKCNQLIAERLIEVSKKQIQYKDEQDLISYGEYIVNDEVWNFEGSQIVYLTNADSLNLKDHEEGTRFQGCCGSSGDNGLNQICINCSEEIGVLVNDCYTPRFIGIDKDKISLKPLW